MSKITTVRVSRSTLEMLERLRNKLEVGSLDETIQALITRYRRMMIDRAFGLDKGRMKPFAEDDRGEDHS